MPSIAVHFIGAHEPSSVKAYSHEGNAIGKAMLLRHGSLVISMAFAFTFLCANKPSYKAV